MLIRFNVKNFRSFGTREDGKSEEFSMIAGRVRRDRNHVYAGKSIKLLKFAAIYGANASGKSNLIRAMRFMQATVVGGIQQGAASDYCKADPENINKPSYFEMEILIDDLTFAYGFEMLLSEARFVSEWLYETKPNSDDKLIFSRDIEKGKNVIGDSFNKGKIGERLKIYLSDLGEDPHTLFLASMNQSKAKFYEEYRSALVFRNVFEWFNRDLSVLYAQERIPNEKIFSNNENIDDICKLLNDFGTGIEKCEMTTIDYDKLLSLVDPILKMQIMEHVDRCRKVVANKIEKVNLIIRSNTDLFSIDIDKDSTVCQTLELRHENQEARYSLGEESDGTKRLLDLLEILLSKEKNKTFVIDELDRCLHPNLSYAFVERFLELAEKRNIQLIVTTHELRLMTFKLLRQDEIWLTNKRIDGQSDIYSLDEFNERFDKKIVNEYIDGRYYAVPKFKHTYSVSAAGGSQ